MELTLLLPLLLYIYLPINNVFLAIAQSKDQTRVLTTQSTTSSSANATSQLSSSTLSYSTTATTTAPTSTKTNQSSSTTTTTISTDFTTAEVTTTTNKPGNVCQQNLTQINCCKLAEDQKCQYYSCNQTDIATLTGCYSSESSDWNTTCQPDTIINACITSSTTSTIASSTTSIKSPNSSGKQGDKSNHQQHFDGASFIGGIVLCAGIVALIFFGLKFYKSRSEANYRTL